MDNIKADKNLMSGKGEEDVQWITANGAHIPIKEGESKQEAVNKFVENKEKQEVVQSLVNVLKRITNVKLKELRDYIKSLSPIKLLINDDEILAQFDKFTAKKNVHDMGKSSREGYIFKLNNLDKLPTLIKNSKYDFSLKESGKKMPQHKNVKEWHYFINQIETEKGKFDVIINIRDKGNEQFVYEVAFRKSKSNKE